MPLFGRDQELRDVHDLIARAGEDGGALLVFGEAGIGKSSILADATAHARELGMTVLAATGIQAETRLAFAGLHQLLRPIIGRVDALPPPQRNALLAAFGMTDEAAPDLFLTALATLELLSDVAAETPVLVVADDTQWLDRATTDVLAFLARRLASDPVVLLAALREGFESPLRDGGGHRAAPGTTRPERVRTRAGRPRSINPGTHQDSRAPRGDRQSPRADGIDVGGCDGRRQSWCVARTIGPAGADRTP